MSIKNRSPFDIGTNFEMCPSCRNNQEINKNTTILPFIGVKNPVQLVKGLNVVVK